MAIENVSIADNGHLMIVLSDGTVKDAGNVRGVPGPQGDKGIGVKGDKGEPGLKGDTGGTAGFAIANTASTASWVNLGTWTTVNQGTTLYMRIVAHAGFNADTTQSQVTEVYFKTSNGTSNANGFYGDCTVSRNSVLGTCTTSPSTIRVVQNSQTSYTFYGYFGTWTDGSHYTYSTDNKSSWVHSGAIATAPTGTYIDVIPMVSDIRMSSGYVDAGTFITLDNIKASVTTSGNRGLSVATVSGTFTAMISGTFGYISGTGGSATNGANNPVYTTTPSGSWFGWNFPNAGDGSTYLVNDITNNRFYRINLMIGPGYSKNFISIERLY